MFTGIVEELGTVRAVDAVGDGRRLVVAAETVLDDVTLGASVAVNGCCLTVVEWGDEWFAVDAVPETLERTTIGDLAIGDPVNLERPLAADGRFGGHVVQGHVDTVTEVLAVVDQSDGSRWLTFRLPEDLAGQVVEKGSVTLDGTSLTVASVGQSSNWGHTFDVALIPHTLEVTTLGGRSPGDRLNVEADVIARYVAGLLGAGRISIPTAELSEKKKGD
jgi:riboflavin synthase